MSGSDKDVIARLEQLEARVSELEKAWLKTTSRRRQLRSKGPLGATLKLYEEGFFKTPREFQEICQELARHSYYYQRGHIYTALTRDMMQNRALITRIGKKGEWKYVERK